MKRFFLSFILICLTSQLAYAEPMIISYPRPPEDNDARAAYALRIIGLAMKKTEEDFGFWKVQFSADGMERPRMESTVEKGDIAQVLMLPGSDDYDKRFTLIPIPIDKGLIGFRISLVHRDNRNLFAKTTTLDALKKPFGCLARTWQITKVFDYNRLNVRKTDKYKDLFNLVQNKRCDYFSRGVGELLSEFGYWSQSHPDIAIEPHILLRTPLAFYLYVSKSKPKIAKRLEVGLQRALEDGSFEKLFQDEFNSAIMSLRIMGRRVITLDQAKPHSNAPYADTRLWFRP